VVNHYEENKELLEQNPEALALNLRDIGVRAGKADIIASIQFHKRVSTAGAFGYPPTS